MTKESTADRVKRLRNLISLRRSYGSTDDQIAEILVQERVCEDFEVARYYVATTDDKGSRRSLLA